MKCYHSYDCPSRSHDPNERQKAFRKARSQAANEESTTISLWCKGANMTIHTDAKGKQSYPWQYAKLLSHDPRTLLPSKTDQDKLRACIENPTRKTLAKLPLKSRSKMKHEDIIGHLSFEAAAPDAYSSHLCAIAQQYHVSADSVHAFYEMLEVYAMALARDVPFEQWQTDPLIARLYSSLNAFYSRHRLVGIEPPTLNALFRGSAPDVEKGHYISQCLLQDLQHGAMPLKQEFRPEMDMKQDAISYIEMIHGLRTNPLPPIKCQKLHNLRVLASAVHHDPVYIFYFNAAVMLAQKMGFTNRGTDTYSNFLTGGMPDLLTSLAIVARNALRAAWVAKWHMMKIRPEEMAARFESHVENDDVHLFPQTLETEFQNNDILLLSRQKFKSLLLTQMYPEGAPTHPSYPAGHATVAGACVTIIKCYIRTHNSNGKIRWVDSFGIPQSCTRNALVEGIDNQETVTGELNKLAYNVSLGRNAAGVHFQSDCEGGLRMGEAVAVNYIRSMKENYTTKVAPMTFDFEDFNGHYHTI